MSIPTSKQIAARLDALEVTRAEHLEWFRHITAALGTLTRRVAALEAPEAPAAPPDPEAPAKRKRTRKR